MSTARRPLDAFAVSTMIVLCGIWGAQQVAIKLAAGDIVPTMQLAIRSGSSALLVGLLSWRRGEKLSFRGRTWRPGVVAGALFAAEFLFVGEGLRFTSASHMSVFLYTAPIFTALGLHALVPAERLRGGQWLGVAIAFAGVAVTFAGGSLEEGISLRTLWGDVLGVLAGAAWGATTVIVRSSALSEAPPTQTLLYQLAAAFVVLLAAATMSGQVTQVALTRVACASLLFQGLVVSFASYLTWFWLLRGYIASHMAVFSFLTPLFGVSLGVLVLHEGIGLHFSAGAALVLVGITVVSRSGSSCRTPTRVAADGDPVKT